MKRLAIFAFGAALCTAPLALPGTLQALAQSPAYQAPRNALGQPDLGEYWSNASLTPEIRPARFSDQAVYTPDQVAEMEKAADRAAVDGNRPTDPAAPAPTKGGDKPPPGTRPEFAAAAGAVGGYNYGWLDPGSRVMRVHGEPRTSILTTPNGRPPPLMAGATFVGYGRGYGGGLGSFDNPENRSLGERCILGFGRNAGPPMLANGFYNNDYQFVQSRDSIAILVEMVHDVRIIRLDAKHRADNIRPWMGDSVGHWDGDTLVVETTNIPQAQAYHGAWKDLTVTERFTRVAKDRLLYQFTISAPSLWAQPWGGEYEFAPLKGIIYEYACHEGNYALQDMLSGARAEEAKAAADKAAAAKPAPNPASPKG